MSTINGSISVHNMFVNKNPIIVKCALTVTVAISWLMTSPLILKILSQTNACAHMAAAALPADPHIHHYISSPFTRQCCGHYPAMSLSTRQVKAHLKVPTKDAVMVGWMWKFINGHKDRNEILIWKKNTANSKVVTSEMKGNMI